MKQPELGKKIAELRKAKGLTQDELVKKCNLSIRTLQRIESGEVIPRSYTVKLIFEALDSTFAEVIEEQGETEIGILFRDWRFNQLMQLFNLKHNTMKKLSVLSALIIAAVLFVFAYNANAKCEKNRLVGTWRLFKANNNGANVSRTLVFTGENTFESQNVNHTTYNRGAYSLLNDSVFVTVHDGSDNANLYHFEIINDSLHFYGNYLRPVSDNTFRTVFIDEWWVRVPKKSGWFHWF